MTEDWELDYDYQPTVLEGWVKLTWSTADGYEKPSKWKKFKRWIRKMRNHHD